MEEIYKNGVIFLMPYTGISLFGQKIHLILTNLLFIKNPRSLEEFVAKNLKIDRVQFSYILCCYMEVPGARTRGNCDYHQPNHTS